MPNYADCMMYGLCIPVSWRVIGEMQMRISACHCHLSPGWFMSYLPADAFLLVLEAMPPHIF